ncbi:MAG: MFS transporter [Holophagales bacterium]|nr:MFS transporter [Holophagales bacterium]
MSDSRAPVTGSVPARLAARGLAVLTLINLFNYLDRFVVASLVESLRASELRLTDTQAGALMTGFIVVYMVASPFFGVLGDRGSRPRLLALGVFVWSLATAAAGLAKSFASLFAARAAVGIGEAAYGTIAPSLLADYFPREKRGRVYAIFFCAIPIGSALGYIVGGYADAHLGWRAAFFVAGLPGLLLALLALTLPDPPRGASDEGEPPPRGASTETGWGSYLALAKNRPFRIAVLGYAAYTFGIGGMAFWMPAFLERVRGVPKEAATVQFGLVVVVTGFVGTFAGGFLGDALLKRTKEAYLWVSGVATLIAVPFAFVALTVPDPRVYFPALVVAQLFVFASTGPINSAIVNDVLPWQRAAAVAACNFTIHVLGDVPSPPLLGALSDASSLETAVLLVPIAFLVGGAIWTWGALSGRRG